LLSKDNFYKKGAVMGWKPITAPFAGYFFYFVFSFFGIFHMCLHLLKIICITSLLLDNPLFSV